MRNDENTRSRASGMRQMSTLIFVKIEFPNQIIVISMKYTNMDNLYIYKLPSLCFYLFYSQSHVLTDGQRQIDGNVNNQRWFLLSIWCHTSMKIWTTFGSTMVIRQFTITRFKVVWTHERHICVSHTTFL